MVAPHEVLARGCTLKAAVASANSYNLHGLSRSAVSKVCVCVLCACWRTLEELSSLRPSSSAGSEQEILTLETRLNAAGARRRTNRTIRACRTDYRLALFLESGIIIDSR